MEKGARTLVVSIAWLFVLAMFLIALAMAVPSFNSAADKTYNVSEDTLFTWNFTANVSNPEPPMTFTFTLLNLSTNPNFTKISDFYWISLNKTTGVMTINATRDNETGFLESSVEVRNSTNHGTTSPFNFNISSVNDAPVFVGLENKSFNMSSLFDYIINVTDEENNTDFSFNISFVNCFVAEWSTRNCATNAGRELFSSSDYTTDGTIGQINISFTPTRNDVGNYTINFTVTDAGTPNATTTQIVNFTVLNVNAEPYFNYVCDNERTATENSRFTCRINATDVDEINNLTFVANYTWFTFNATGNNSTIITVGSSTGFNASAFVNFTAADTEVGNWSINVTLTDTGGPVKSNSTTFYFFISNVNDSVVLDSISDVLAVTSNNYTIYVNATDDDLLIPDETAYNESLTFTSNNTNVNVSGLEISGTNKTRATITFDPTVLGTGNHSINITVRDSRNFSIDSDVFFINVTSNTLPAWNAVQTNHSLTENTEFYLNLTQNVTDTEGNPINFSYSNTTGFSSFSLNQTTGVINFTPIDIDVGEHIITINATDGETPTPLEFNFTVSNVDDAPSIVTPLTVTNASVDTGSNITTEEDNNTVITLFVDDNDFRIPSNQKNFYNESITVNLTIQGTNTKLFSFVRDSAFPSTSQPQRASFDATFSPNKTDVGNYNITINTTDKTNSSVVLKFNLTITEVQHAPTMINIGNVNTSILEIFFIDVNVTDLEDINETFSGSNMTYKLENLTVSGNFLTINSTTGVINFTMNQTYAGRWEYNLSVNDSTNRIDSEIFNVTVYDYPVILLPLSSFEFGLVENISSRLNFTINHTVQDDLNYTLIINGVIRNSTSGYGNETDFLWNFTANFTDETTCLSTTINLTLNVSNAKLSNLTNWNITINHTNYPLSFSGSIGGSDELVTGGLSALVTLSDFFTDIDATDSCRNQTIGFNYTLISSSSSGGTITVSTVNWTNTTTPTSNFSASTSGTSNYTIWGMERNESNGSQILNRKQSNNFTVQLTISPPAQPTGGSGSTSGGGGGGGSRPKLISLNIIVPGPVSSKQKDRLVIPISIINDGKISLREIILDATVAKNGVLRSDLIASFDKSFIQSLSPDEQENVTLIVDVNTQETGLFEVTINADVKNPEFSDSAKVFIEIDEEKEVREKIIFTEEFVIGNPECAELKELLDEASLLLEQGDSQAALLKTEETLDACRRAISQPAKARIYGKIEENLFSYVSLASFSAFAFGFAYYYYRRRKLRRMLEGY